MLLSVVLSLWYAVGKSNTICSEVGEIPPYNNGMNNYVVGQLEIFSQVFLTFPFAIGQCTSHSIVTSDVGPYFTHTCTSSSELTTEQFTDSKCSTNAVSTTKTESNSNVGEVGYFQCSGDDTYAELSLATGIGQNSGDTACSNLQTIYAGLNGCMDNIQGLGEMLSVYCNSTIAIIEWFSESLTANGRNNWVIENMWPESSENPMTTTEVNPGIPSTTSSDQCDSKFFCNSWPLRNNGECNNVVISQQNLLWGSMLSCTGTTGDGNTKDATRIYLTLWTGLIAAIFALVL